MANAHICHSAMSRTRIDLQFRIRDKTIAVLVVLRMALMIVLLACGDIHENPGPRKPATRTDCASELRILHINVNSITAWSRLQDLEVLKTSENIDIICINESKLSSAISDADVRLSGFHDPVRRDRTRHGGGVMVYIRDTLEFRRRTDLECNDLEIIFIEAFVTKSRSIVLGTCYRSPSQNRAEEKTFTDRISCVLERALLHNPFCLVLTGDFNMRSINWKKKTATNAVDKDFLGVVNLHNLSQLVSHPTRRDSLLDLVLTDSPALLNELLILPKLDDTSDARTDSNGT